MVTFKFKLNLSRVTGRKGSLSLQVIHRRRPCAKALGYYLHPWEWDEENQEIVLHSAGESRRQYLNHAANVLERSKARLTQLIDDFELREAHTSQDILTAFLAINSCRTLSSFVSKLCKELILDKRDRTSRAYRSFLNSFMAFNEGRDVALESITPALIKSYEWYLKDRGCMPNTVSFYMRNGRAIYNLAIREKLLFRVEESPFSGVYTQVERTTKRAVDEKVIRSVSLLEMPDEKGLQLSKDLFMLSFYFRGMAFVDLCFLKKEDIRSGVLRYRRSKTGQSLEIKLTTEIQEILKRYSSQTEDSPYLLPIIKDQDKSVRLQYESALRTHNSRLHRISERLDLEQPLTSYVTRHSWATIAKRKGVPLALISESLGHTSEKTTRIYLGSFSVEQLDEVNRKIIGHLKKVI